MSEGWNGLSPNKFMLNSPDIQQPLSHDTQLLYNNNNHPLMPAIPPEFGTNIYNGLYYNSNSVGSSNGVGGVLSPSPQLNSPDINMTTPAELQTHVSNPFVDNDSFQTNSVLNSSLANYPGNQSNLTTPFENRSLLPQDLSTVHPLQLESQNVNMEDYLVGTLVPTTDVTQNLQNSKTPSPPTNGYFVNGCIRDKHALLGKRGRPLNKNVTSSKLVASSPVSLINTTARDDQSPHQSRSNVATSIGSGNQSDTSSGVSSSHKMSISESSTPSSPSSLHDYITCDLPDVEIFPIREPNPGLGGSCEYMLTNPIRPPSPPMVTDIELNPNVPIFEVCSTCNVCTCICTCTCTCMYVLYCKLGNFQTV